MKIQSSLTLIYNLFFATLVHAQENLNRTGSNGTYPTTFRATGFNSTENELKVGTTPIVPFGEIIKNDPWSTPLVDGCPKLCSVVGSNPSNWTHVHDQKLLARCEEPFLFSLNVQNDPDQFATIRTCALKAGKAESKRQYIDTIVYKRQQEANYTRIDVTNLEKVEQQIASSGDSCGAYKSSAKAVLTVGPAGVVKAGSDAAAAAISLASYLKTGAGCGTNIVFAKTGAAVVGVYAGADLPSTTAGKLLGDSSATAEDQIGQGTELLQLCNPNSPEATTFGVFAAENFEKSLGKVQEALRTWANGECAIVSGKREENVEWTILTAEPQANSTLRVKRSVSSTIGDIKSLVTIEKRAECRAIQVVKDDGCASLAARCGIRGADFTKYNPKANLCSTLVEKQWVCCTRSLHIFYTEMSTDNSTDMRPKPQPDGTCAVYIVQENDGCKIIADSFGLNVTDIDKFNKGTWGWSGCPRIQPDQILCVSTGNTPMPAQIDGVACGPQKPGTQKPSGKYDGFDLAKLNPCPLKACCSGWGFCGTTAEFCTESKSETGAPGSFKKGENGCIQSCGMDIVGNDMTPGGFARVGYFQAYNGARECLNMDVSEVTTAEKSLTHVHFAFVGITADFKVNVAANVKEQFDKFNSGKFPFKKIISFGGWAESTEPGTFQRYKDAVKPENRNTFANNVLSFLNANDLHGVDFDWEYPGATDIPGVPSGGEMEAQNYLRFLTVMKGLLGNDGKRSLSIALPASFWYLKPFPVDKMAGVVDYFIYMTYDLHGQWDYGNKFANPGCDSGNCLRSHINKTETHNALSMITKAGVPARQLFVGVSSYGRSFRMADKSCTGEQCKFTGSFGKSDAEPGQCTGTGGYIANAELNEIARYAEEGVDGFSAKKWYEEKIDTDIMTYGTQGKGMTDWVAYMTPETKARRTDWIRGLNMGGTTDWAVDLSGWYKGSDKDDKGAGWDVDAGDILECNSNDWPKTLESLESGINSVPVHCRAEALLRVLVGAYDAAIQEYNTVKKDYDDKFGWYADWVKDAINDRLDVFLGLINGDGLKYMDCKWETRKVKGEGPCTEARAPWDGGPNGGPRVVTFKMRDEEGFYKELLEKTGIKKNWVTWRDDAINDPCVCPPPMTCPNCGTNYYMRKNFPRRINDGSKIDVDNPKKIIDEAIPNMAELTSIALATYLESRLGTLDADGADVVQSLAMPLFMLQDASVSIKEIKEIGEEQKKQKTQALVMMILTIVFAVIPFAGVAAQALGGAVRIAQAALIIGEAGNAALTIVEIVKDPLSAPFAILGMLLGAGGIRAKGPRQAFGDAASARRALDSGDKIKLFSAEFQRKDKLVQNIKNACVR
ncbi:hypothetical protein B0J11DRAFT_431313 [Dendryphion nanum]|uniref:chitinase n=1 Tax=Dendryphion nanum TaxID=256645 RepID=A0A9P9DYA0_9PLEO|nr:hypothetical protein B0J11DRAFT_431313 [Dendryphion nanum]